jgi:hypothetical protein
LGKIYNLKGAFALLKWSFLNNNQNERND